MTRFTNPLKHVQIAAPCQADWDEMYAFGGERVRYCSACKLNVYNLSAMKRREAEALLLMTEGRLCVRFYRRADGTILTQNCPVGWRALKQRVSWVVQLGVGMVIGLLADLGITKLVRTPYPMFGKPPVEFVGIIAQPEPEECELSLRRRRVEMSDVPREETRPKPKSPPRQPKQATRQGRQ